MSQQIQILNPIDGCRYRTGLKAAQRYVEERRAQWVKRGESIRFIEDHHAHRSARTTALNCEQMTNHDRAVKMGSPVVPAAGLGMVGDAEKLLEEGHMNWFEFSFFAAVHRGDRRCGPGRIVVQGPSLDQPAGG